MGIDIVVYRQRIGSFLPKVRTKNGKYGKYDPCTMSSDIQYRVLACMVVGLYIAITVKAYMEVSTYMYEQTCTLSANDFCSLSAMCLPYNVRCLHEIHSINNCSKTYIAYCSRLLMLSSDVELNPGPTEETEMILRAITESTHRTTMDLNEVKEELKSMRNDLAGVKSNISSIKSKLKTVEDISNKNDHRLCKLEEDIANNWHNEEVLQSDIDAIDTKVEAQRDYIETLENKIDRLEAEQRKNNARIFGVNELVGEDTKQIVHDKIIKLLSPTTNFSESCIEHAKRIGKAANGQSRAILVSFRCFEDKMKLFSGRNELRKRGIRVANELTSRQWEQMKNYKQRGITGYFKNGKFFRTYHDDTDQPRGNQRVFKQAVRQTGRSNGGTTGRRDADVNAGDGMIIEPAEDIGPDVE